MSSLIQCVYSSIASFSFSESELPTLLTAAQEANAKRGVTGMLTYVNGIFLQVLEGEEETVDLLVAKISADPRHKRILVLVREPIDRRSFGDWSMGFEALLPAPLEALIGENDFFDASSCVDALDAGVVKSILMSFREAQRGVR